MAKELKRRDLSGIFIFDTFPGESHRRPTCIEDCQTETRRRLRSDETQGRGGQRMKRRIYLSGGMSGWERAEYVRRFGEAERILRRHGYGCINPCRVWACRFQWFYRAMEWTMGKRLAYAVVLCYDLLLLMTRADGIAMLPGWQASRGAQIENYVSMHFWMQGISKAVTDEIEKIK